MLDKQLGLVGRAWERTVSHWTPKRMNDFVPRLQYVGGGGRGNRYVLAWKINLNICKLVFSEKLSQSQVTQIYKVSLRFVQVQQCALTIELVLSNSFSKISKFAQWLAYTNQFLQSIKAKIRVTKGLHQICLGWVSLWSSHLATNHLIYLIIWFAFIPYSTQPNRWIWELHTWGREGWKMLEWSLIWRAVLVLVKQ